MKWMKWREVRGREGKGREVKLSAVKWYELKWREVNEMKWREVNWCELMWIEVTWSEVKWIEVMILDEMRVLSQIYSNVAVFRFCAVNCVIIICFSLSFSNYSSYVLLIFFLYLFSGFVCLFSVWWVLCCIVSPQVYSCLFPICVQVYWPLPQGGNPIAVNKNSQTHTYIYIYIYKSTPLWAFKASYRVKFTFYTT